MSQARIPTETLIEIGGEEFLVFSTRITETVSEVPLIKADIGLIGNVPDPEKLLGADLVATIRMMDGSKQRQFCGTVIKAKRLGDADGSARARVVAAPKIWRLTKRSNCRIFQNKTAVEIIQAVMTDGGVEPVEVQVGESYEPRLHCAQYRETDFEFVQRLMSEEGMYFVVHHADGAAKLILADDKGGVGDAPDNPMSFHTTFGYEFTKPVVSLIERTQRVTSDKVYLRDYDFERPKAKVEAKAESKDDGAKALEVYVFPGRFTKEAVGSRYAQVLLDSIQARRDILSGKTTSLGLAPGLKLQIEDHPYEPMNQEIVLTSVVTETRDLRSFGTGDNAALGPVKMDYSCTFEGIPTAKSALRTKRVARAVEIPGIQTALTTGPSGQEIHSDKHGRVKVLYPWDRQNPADDTSSTWMRTSQAPTGGSMLLPRCAWEVVVEHWEGDTDVPLVMSRMYNTVTPPPYALPAGKARGALQTATTPGGGSSNEMRTDDTKGKEEMFFNASKDMTIDVLNNETESVGNNETIAIGSNQTLHVTNSREIAVGSNQTIDIGGNQNVKISTFAVDEAGGDFTYTVGGNRDMKIGGDHRRTVAGASTVDVGAMHTDLVVGKVNEQTLASMNVDVGAASVAITVADYSMDIGANHTESAGAAKVVVAFGGREVSVGGNMTQKVAGAILAKVDGDVAIEAGATLTSVAAGAHILKADNVVYEGEGLVTFVMGASAVIMTPASISLMGVSIKLDGATAETAALIIDN